jgi:hypothetical protein
MITANDSPLFRAGNVYTLFVRKYAKYLEEKVSVLRLIGLQFEKTRDACKSLPDKEAFKRVPKLQSQLNALLNCKVCHVMNMISNRHLSSTARN